MSSNSLLVKRKCINLALLDSKNHTLDCKRGSLGNETFLRERNVIRMRLKYCSVKTSLNPGRRDNEKAKLPCILLNRKLQC